MAEKKSKISLESVFGTMIQIPGVKVRRRPFLRKQFEKEAPIRLQEVLSKGPIETGYRQDGLMKRSKKLLTQRSLVSTAASVGAGIPGGLAATIPVDFAQFYGIALRLCQEIAYLYGEPDLWDLGELNQDKVKQQLLLYLGVMLDVRGASQTLQLITAKRMGYTEEEPTEVFGYKNVITSIAKNLGIELSKELVEQGVRKLIPVVGSVISGGITFVSMRSMGMKLIQVLDKACFDYQKADFQKDMEYIKRLSVAEPVETVTPEVIING